MLPTSNAVSPTFQFYNTWLTCEEVAGGQVWEVDPKGTWFHQTLLGGDGDKYESAAYDNRDPTKPTFYVTTDKSNGALVKFTPDPLAVQDAIDLDDYTALLTTPGNTKHEYLKLNYDARTFSWTTSLSEGRASARLYFKNSEGIDIREGKLYFTTKVHKHLFILDLDNFTFAVSSTKSGAFDSQPDQIASIVGNDGILYFCEDGSNNAGVHARDANGRFYTILQDEGGELFGETTGLAFSPDNMFMYAVYQKAGRIYEIKGTDGYPFNGQRLDIKYHDDDTNTDAFNN